MAQGISGILELKDNSYGATFRVYYSETYDIAANTSSVTITKLEVSQSAYYGVTHYFHGTITINGSTAVTLSNNGLYVGAKNTFYQIPDASGSVSVAHNSDGSKSTSISVSAKAYNGSSQLKWSVSGSKTIALTTIPRASSFTVSNGTLGVAQTIKVTRQSTSFSHTITYKCGVASGTICDKSTAESISFTPPIDLAGQNTTGTSLTMTFTLQTYSGSTAVGSAVTASVSMAIPASVKPGCSLSYMDASGYADRFGGYVQGQSKLLIALVGSAAYGSPIASYRTVVNGTTYTASSFTTGVLTGTGNQTISATVTDKRGRTSDPVTATINVLAYSAPRISKLSVNRCNEDGTENNTGSFAKVTYSFSITSLSEKNTKIATLYYKKSSDSSYTPKVLESVYSVTNGTFIFPADDGSSYDVYIELKDTFTSTKKSTSVSTADVIMHFRADGKGMGCGKVSEKSNALDMGWDIELNGHSLLSHGKPPFAPAGKTIMQGLGTHGWYRVGVLYVGHDQGFTAIAQMAIGGWNNYQNATPAIIDIAFDYGGGYLHKVFNTLRGTHFTSVRLCRIDNFRVAVDVYYGGSGANTVYVTVHEIQGVFTANTTFVDVSSSTELVIATLNMTKAQTTQIDLLWVNATPGVSFPAQTIPLDLSRYDCVEVVASVGELPNIFFGSTKVPIGQSGSTGGFGSDYWFHSRNFTASSTGIDFQSGYMRDPNGKIYENWDGRSVPYKIYGIKEGQ